MVYTNGAEVMVGHTDPVTVTVAVPTQFFAQKTESDALVGGPVVPALEGEIVQVQLVAPVDIILKISGL
jgi:hypothetical protein